MTETLDAAGGDETHEREVISLPRRPLSRRALMKAAGIAPFIALAKRAWADPTPANMVAVANVEPIPQGQVDIVRDAADVYAKANNKKNVNLDQVELVARSLWIHFHLGLAGACADSSIASTLLKRMYDEPSSAGKKTGEIVVDNIDKGNFDAFGEDYQTNVCAYVCGHKVALAAMANTPPTFDSKMYTKARTETETEMKAKLAKSCGDSKNPAGVRGFGC